MTDVVIGELHEDQRSAFLALMAQAEIPTAVADDALNMALEIVDTDRGFALTLEDDDTGELLGVLLSSPYIANNNGFHDANTLVLWLLILKPTRDPLPWQDLISEHSSRAIDRGYQRLICTAASTPAHFEFLEGDLWNIAAVGNGVCWYGDAGDAGLWVLAQYPEPDNPSHRLAYWRLDEDDPEGSHLREIPPSLDPNADAIALPLFGTEEPAWYRGR